MGQHKTNPTAIAAARGELPPRPPKVSKKAIQRELHREIRRIIYGPLTNAAFKAYKGWD